MFKKLLKNSAIFFTIIIIIQVKINSCLLQNKRSADSLRKSTQKFIQSRSSLQFQAVRGLTSNANTAGAPLI